MLMLARKKNERIRVPAIGMTLQIVSVKGDTVRIGIEAPDDILVLREELAVFNPEVTLADQLLEQRQAKHEARNHLQELTNKLQLAIHQYRHGKSSTDDIFSGVEESLWKIQKCTGQTPSLQKKSLSKTVLLIDNNINESMMLSTILRMSGFNVIGADSFEEGVGFLKGNDYNLDAILINYSLEHSEGFLSTIDTLGLDKKTKVFAMHEGDFKANSNVDEWFSKPLHTKDLVCKIGGIEQKDN